MNGFQKLLLIAVHVTIKSKNGGTFNGNKNELQKLLVSRLLSFWFTYIQTFEFVHAATISCIAHGVTITMYPKDIAAIVRDADPFNLRSNEIT